MKFLTTILGFLFVAAIAGASGGGSIGMSGLTIPYAGSSLFDDFVTGVTAANIGIGTLGWYNGGNNGGGLTGFAAGATPTTVYTGRVGTVELFTGTSNNATGQAFIALSSAVIAANSGIDTTLYYAVLTPSALSGAPKYWLDAGCITGEGSASDAKAGNGVFIRYNADTSTNWMSEVCNAGVCTETTTADAADFAVAAATWYNMKVHISGSAASADFWIAPGGSQQYVQLGSAVTTHLPDAADACHPVLQILKAGSASTTSRKFVIDWFRMDNVFTPTR